MTSIKKNGFVTYTHDFSIITKKFTLFNVAAKDKQLKIIMATIVFTSVTLFTIRTNYWVLVRLSFTDARLLAKWEMLLSFIFSNLISIFVCLQMFSWVDLHTNVNKMFRKQCKHVTIFSIFPQVKHNWIITIAALFSRQLLVSNLHCHFQILFPTILSFMKPQKTSFLVSRETENSGSSLITLPSPLALFFSLISSTSPYWRRRRRKNKKNNKQLKQFEKKDVCKGDPYTWE